MPAGGRVRRARQRLIAILGAGCLVLVAAGCDADDDAGDDAGLEPAATTAPVSETIEAADTATDATTGEAETVEVQMVNISFDPAEITIPVASTVIWTNADSVAHTTTADDGTWDSGTMEPGDTFEFTFDEPGTYSYVCEIHPAQMQATVVVEG